MTELPTSDSKHNNAELLTTTLEKAAVLLKERESGHTLHADWMETPFGPMVLAGDDGQLHLITFLGEDTAVIRILVHIQKINKARIQPGESPVVTRAKQELEEYFEGKRKTFDLPLSLHGTTFQELVWNEIQNTTFGHTITYADLAKNMGRPTSFRAAAQACSQNPIAIVVPCHRVINADDNIGGYLGGTERKVQLLDFEKNAVQNNR